MKSGKKYLNICIYYLKNESNLKSVNDLSESVPKYAKVLFGFSYFHIVF